MVLFFDHLEVKPEPLEHRLDNDSACSVHRCENDRGAICRSNEIPVQDQSLEPLHVSFVDFALQHGYFAACFPLGLRDVSLLMQLTLAMIPLACGSTTCAPSSK